MYAARNLSFAFIVRFAWKPLLIYFVYTTAITLLFEIGNMRFLAFPFVPIGLIGTAVAFYVGFKNNSSYERLWEARKLWGAIVNISRSFTISVLDYCGVSQSLDSQSMKEHQRMIIYRHLAYINALRIQLRLKRIWDDQDDAFTSAIDSSPIFRNNDLLEQITEYLHPDEARDLNVKTNTATHILRKQSEHILFLHENGCVDTYKHVELTRMLTQLYDQQGACERIKTYPFPRQYAFFSELFVWLLAALLPFGLLGELSKFESAYVWFTIPMSLLIFWVFNVMEIIGDASENPFENAVNDIPMTAICRTIEIDLRELLGEEKIPKKIRPQKDIIM